MLQTVAPLPGEEALYGQMRAVLDAAAKDPAIKQSLIQAATETEKNVVDPFLEWKHNGRPAGNGWNRSTNNARFGVDYFNRTGTAKSNMFDNKPTETQYFYTDGDTTGASLDGKNNYEITFAAGQEPPVNGFWSLTLYNAQHFFHPNDLKRYSLGTKTQAKCRRLAHALRRRQIAGQGQGEQLAPGSRRPLLTLHPLLLGQATVSRRLLAATQNRECDLSARGRRPQCSGGPGGASTSKCTSNREIS